MSLITPRYKTHQTISSNAATSPYFTVKEMATIYGFPSPNPSSTSVVGIISFGGGLHGIKQGTSSVTVLPANAAKCDVQIYWKYLGYTAEQMPQVIVYPVNGATNNLYESDGTGENTLDVSVIGGCYPSPNLTIILFIFPNTYTFSQALPIALVGVTIGSTKYVPSVISISWGSPESGYFQRGETKELTTVNNILQAATQNGVNICVASGDNGSTNGTSALTVDFPASSPYVTAVGGTSLKCPNKVYDSSTREIVWNNGTYAATGGGISAFFPKPTWQSVGSGNYRNVPDISLNSDPRTGLILYLGGQLQAGWGGTSMAAPMFAAYLALMKPSGFVNPILYSLSANNYFNDIIQGTNNNANIANSYNAGIGYDCCSGLGSINGSNLKNVLAPTPTPAPTPAPPKKPVLISAISLNPSVINITINVPYKTTGTLLPSNASNKKIAWATSNPNVVLVNGNGVILGKKKGTALIRAATTDGSNKYAYATVVVKAAGATKGKIRMYKGKIFTTNIGN